jgi:hypothetical protein
MIAVSAHPQLDILNLMVTAPPIPRTNDPRTEILPRHQGHQFGQRRLRGTQETQDRVEVPQGHPEPAGLDPRQFRL